MIIIKNTNVYGLHESIRASGLPMRTSFDTQEDYSKALTRAIRLGSCTPNSGHDCFLKGIHVQADISACGYWWQQWQRYHFQDIISSQSKMHKLLSFDLESMFTHNVTEEAKDNLKSCIGYYKDGMVEFEFVLDNCPQGLLLTARVETNYLQLKTTVNQRKTHRLKAWQDYIKWADNLELFKELTRGA